MENKIIVYIANQNLQLDGSMLCRIMATVLGAKFGFILGLFHENCLCPCQYLRLNVRRSNLTAKPVVGLYEGRGHHSRYQSRLDGA